MTQPKSFQRLVLSLIGLAMIAAMWRWVVHHLYVLPVHSLAAFTSVTNNAFYTISAIVIFMVTGRLIYEWRNSTAARSDVSGTVEDRTERMYRCEKLDPKDIDEEASGE